MVENGRVNGCKTPIRGLYIIYITILGVLTLKCSVSKSDAFSDVVEAYIKSINADSVLIWAKMGSEIIAHL